MPAATPALDFGALICTARKPNCAICPMRGIVHLLSTG
ncbi:hypothetical protein CLG94_11340 [Candidatus Methylomirabilis limnetica]|uniref:Adenine glycosylase n=1 Tax=Candidatus Methylomirabilis limnetica TaxID=2033718 RepID=A0A2T4TVN9_9BACT|nr:hypothetical protein CLG94_11340 [Candidatus Methylomirabilis limnetica]